MKHLHPRLQGAVLTLTLGACLGACDTSTPPPARAGGSTASGGVKGSGGTSSGGTVATGGTASGGTQSSGGATPGTGGTVRTGGSTVPTGGTGSPITGGAARTGGVVASSGGSSSGGAIVSSGGVSRVDAGAGGSSPSTGGAVSGGTVAASGGAVSTGGMVRTGGSGSPASCAPSATGHYQMEDLDRGVVAVKVSGGVYVGWRMMGYEYNPTAPDTVAYNVYRDGTKIGMVTDSTNYLDAAGTASSTYAVSAVLGGVECEPSAEVKTLAQNYLSVPLQVPPNAPTGATYSANDATPGDLDGDGRYDLVLKWDPSDAKDSSQAGKTGNVILDGLTLEGKRLWRIDLGINIRAGAHDTQLSVYDLDGDGKAEVGCKTAPGSKDGTGKYLSTGPAASDTDTTDYRNSDGYILTGPEYYTVFDGATGKELATMLYPVPRNGSVTSSDVNAWGDKYGNRVNRFNGGVSFVKEGGTATGKPSIITQRGYYTRLTVSSLLFRGGALSKNWIFDSDGSGNGAAAGQGNHNLMTADVDGDGAMELIPGSSTINSNGTLRCTTKLGHGDAMHVGELIKGKGIKVFMPHEGDGGWDLHDAGTCDVEFKGVSESDNGRGAADWVSMTQTKSASCSSSRGGNLFCSDGATGAVSAGSNFFVYWDADEAREIQDDITISKAGGGALLTATGTASCNGTKKTPTLTADLFGDWREELVLRTTDNSALRIYTTTDVTKRRIYTLMHDPTYRMQVSLEQSSYNQPPHPSFMIGPGMPNPPKPDIHVK